MTERPWKDYEKNHKTEQYKRKIVFEHKRGVIGYGQMTKICMRGCFSVSFARHAGYPLTHII